MITFKVERTGGGQGAEGEYAVTESCPLPRREVG